MKMGHVPLERAPLVCDGSRRALGLAVGVHGVHHGRDILRRRELGDTVAQIKYVSVAVFRLAEGVQHFMHLGADLLGAGEQDRGVQIALQTDLVADQLARLRQVHGPVQAHRLSLIHI